MESTNTLSGTQRIKFVHPLQISWSPKEDISTYELALCIPLLVTMSQRFIMPYDFDFTLPHMRNFTIIDPNKPNQNEPTN